VPGAADSSPDPQNLAAQNKPIRAARSASPAIDLPSRSAAMCASPEPGQLPVLGELHPSRCALMAAPGESPRCVVSKPGWLLCAGTDAAA